MNEALARLDAAIHLAVQGEANSPPASSDDGEAWLVGNDPAEAWAGQAGAVAVRVAGQWLFLQPVPGMRLYDTGVGQFAYFSAGWQKPVAIQEPTGGSVVDSEARVAISALISALRAAGIFPSE